MKPQLRLEASGAFAGLRRNAPEDATKAVFRGKRVPFMVVCRWFYKAFWWFYGVLWSFFVVLVCFSRHTCHCLHVNFLLLYLPACLRHSSQVLRRKEEEEEEEVEEVKGF